MTIEKDSPPGFWHVLCDRCCSSELGVDATKYPDDEAVIKEINAYGWEAILSQDGVEHVCPECQDYPNT